MDEIDTCLSTRVPESCSSHGRMMSGNVAVDARIVPMLTVRRRSLADGHLCHGPDLWFAGRDGDTLLGVVLVTVSVAVTKTMMAHVTSQVILSICNKY